MNIFSFKKILLAFFIFPLLSLSNSNNQLQVITNKGTFYVPVYMRQGTIYFSLNKLADVLNLDYNVDQKNNSIVLNFDNKSISISAENPFIIISYSKDSHKDVYQLPTTTYTFDNQIYIPLTYTINLLNTFLNNSLKFEEPNKLTVNNSVNSGNVAENTEGKDIYGITLDEKANGTLVTLLSSKKVSEYSSSFDQGVLTITLKNINVKTDEIDRSSAYGLVKSITAKNVNGDSQIKFEVGKDYSTSEVLAAPGSDNILITIHNKIFVNNEDRSKFKEKWEFNTVVLDPGHGGYDSGTIGYMGIKEKDIALAIALKVGKLIQQNLKDINVVYTRKTDKFVELYKRGQIANENNGNLFISIHCNSTPQKPSSANGFEVYLLRPGKTKEAIEIAEKENSVIKYEDDPQRYEKLTDENFILVTMAHSAYMHYSEQFSDILNQELSTRTQEESRGIKQAGFYVLVGASMPSVLIETGFLSNKHDALYLNSAKGQNQIAYAIFEAVKRFKELYEKMIAAEK
jgi:N-acetylmuramoyl-L-alanine amidase